MESDWIERESRRAEIRERGEHGRRMADVCEMLALAARTRRLGWFEISRTATASARHLRTCGDFR